MGSAGFGAGRAGTRVLACLAALSLVFGVTWAAGFAVAGRAAASDPAPPPSVPSTPPTDPAVPLPSGSGLASTVDGYTVTTPTPTFTPGRTADLELRITGPDGAPSTDYETRPDGAPLRLLVLRRDAAGLQVLHPQPVAAGTWRVPLLLPAAGVWRAIAEFVPRGAGPLALGVDLFAPGDFAPLDFPPGRAARVDGYQVRVDGLLPVGRAAPVYVTVSRDGAPVTDLEPVDGSFAELLAFRLGDLAFVPAAPQVRPGPRDRAGPAVAFTALVPEPGVYRVFVLFRHAGAPHLATLTLALPTSTP